MEKDRKFRALAIAAICVAVVGVSVAYAALATTLTITGTATVSTENAWNVAWSNVSTIAKSTAVTVSTTPSAGGVNMTWAASFGAPTDYLSFTATMTNNGTIPAKLGTGTYVPAVSGDAAADFTYTVTIDGKEVADYANYVLEAGKSVDVFVKVEFDKDSTLDADALTALNGKTATFNLSLPFVQATDAEVAATGNKFPYNA